jgi:hypothetical protein
MDMYFLIKFIDNEIIIIIEEYDYTDDDVYNMHVKINYY